MWRSLTALRWSTCPGGSSSPSTTAGVTSPVSVRTSRAAGHGQRIGHRRRGGGRARVRRSVPRRASRAAFGCLADHRPRRGDRKGADPGRRPAGPRAGQRARRRARRAAPAGLVRQFGGGVALVVAVPLGRLSREQLRWLTGVIGDRAARITPWRSVVLPDADAGAAAEAAGLGLGVTAARRGCASPRARADRAAPARWPTCRRTPRALVARWPGRIVHVSGCGRHCGAAAATDIESSHRDRLPDRRSLMREYVHDGAEIYRRSLRHHPGRGRPDRVPRRRGARSWCG